VSITLEGTSERCAWGVARRADWLSGDGVFGMGFWELGLNHVRLQCGTGVHLS